MTKLPTTTSAETAGRPIDGPRLDPDPPGATARDSPKPSGEAETGPTGRPPERLTLRLYVASVVAAALVVGALTVRPQSGGWATVAVIAALGTFMEATSTQTIAGTPNRWSAIAFVCLAAGLIAGPWAVAICAISSSLAGKVRLRRDWVKFFFNAADTFLYSTAAWAIFSAFGGLHAQLLVGALAAALGGAVGLALNMILLGTVIRLAEPTTNLRAFAMEGLAFLPFNTGYGWAAYGAAQLDHQLGWIGVTFLFVPVVLVQLFLIILGRRVDAAEKQRRAHAVEREQLLRRVLTASDTERNRIARDLHDGVVQDLAVLAIGLGQEGRRSGDPITKSTANNAVLAVQEAMTDLRSLLRELAPPDLASSGLRLALEDLADPLRDTGVTVDVAVAAEIDKSAGIIPIFRIVQEALRNIAKHAQAHTVTITAWRDGETARVDITDDGVGFDPVILPERRRDGHVGTQLLSDLATDAHGGVEIETAPGKGTTVHARVAFSPGSLGSEA